MLILVYAIVHCMYVIVLAYPSANPPVCYRPSAGKLVLSGRDAPAAIEWLCSNTVAKAPGASTYTCLLSEANGGGVLADLVVSVLDTPHVAGAQAAAVHSRNVGEEEEPSYYITTGSASKTHDLAHIQSARPDQLHARTHTIDDSCHTVPDSAD